MPPNRLFLTHTAISHNNPPRHLHHNDQQIVASSGQSCLRNFAIVTAGADVNFSNFVEWSEYTNSIRKFDLRLLIKRQPIMARWNSALGTICSNADA